MSVEAILEEAKTLSLDEQKQLIKRLVDLLTEPHEIETPGVYCLRDLRGLGKEIWEEVDVQEYINQQRGQ